MDEIEPLIKSIQALSRSITHRPKSAVFRDLYASVEDALQAGTPRQKILDDINGKSSLALTMGTFKMYLARARKEVSGRVMAEVPTSRPISRRDGAPVLNAPPPAANLTQSAVSVSAPAGNPYTTKDPRALNHVFKTPLDQAALLAAGKAHQKAKRK